jgi:hypothetical protein
MGGPYPVDATAEPKGSGESMSVRHTAVTCAEGVNVYLALLGQRTAQTHSAASRVVDRARGGRRKGQVWESSQVDDQRLVTVDMDDRERAFLRAALLDWDGPARPTQEFAVAMGFGDAEQLPSDTRSLWRRIDRQSALSIGDWRCVLLAAEVIFVSDVVGSGLDWRLTSGFSDEESIAIPRGLQRKMPRWRDSLQFTTDQGGQVKVSGPNSYVRTCRDPSHLVMGKRC